MPNVTISYYYWPMENNKRIHIYERFPIDQFKLNGCINFEGFQSNDDFAKCYDILTRAKYLNVVVQIKTERTTIRCKLGNAHLITDMDINHCGKNIRISEADPIVNKRRNIVMIQTDYFNYEANRFESIKVQVYKIGWNPNHIYIHLVDQDGDQTKAFSKYITWILHTTEPILCFRAAFTDGQSLTFTCKMEKAIKYSNLIEIIGETIVKNKKMLDPLQGVKDNINAKYGVTNVKFMKTCVKPIPKKVYYNNPYTVVIWKDGTKTVVKAPNKHAYNRLTGFMLCYMEKQSGMTKTQFHKWLESMDCYK